MLVIRQFGCDLRSEGEKLFEINTTGVIPDDDVRRVPKCQR
jgi:hypothetical protein